MSSKNSTCVIEQIYNLLMENTDVRSGPQFEKIKRLLFELHTRGREGFSAEKPYRYSLNFDGTFIKLTATDAPRFSNKTKFLAWLFKKLKVI